VDIVDLARATYRKMVQNLWWATGYNAVAIPLAAGVLFWAGIMLSPAIGAVLMSASTVIVAVNARLLGRTATAGDRRSARRSGARLGLTTDRPHVGRDRPSGLVAEGLPAADGHRLPGLRIPTRDAVAHQFHDLLVLARPPQPLAISEVGAFRGTATSPAVAACTPRRPGVDLAPPRDHAVQYDRRIRGCPFLRGEGPRARHRSDDRRRERREAAARSAVRDGALLRWPSVLAAAPGDQG
jgi:hypothetical protein